MTDETELEIIDILFKRYSFIKLAESARQYPELVCIDIVATSCD